MLCSETESDDIILIWWFCSTRQILQIKTITKFSDLQYSNDVYV
jgi:hypothetical protein